MVASTTSISSRPSAVILIISSRSTRGHARRAQPSNTGMTCPKDRPANSRLARQRVTGASATGLSVSFCSRGQHPRAVTLLCPAGEANVAGRIPRRPSLANQSTLARASSPMSRDMTRDSRTRVRHSHPTGPSSNPARPLPSPSPAPASRHPGRLVTVWLPRGSAWPPHIRFLVNGRECGQVLSFRHAAIRPLARRPGFDQPAEVPPAFSKLFSHVA
jgi:hypothetical protein